MARRKRTPEENARREKIRELLQLANIGSMDDIQRLFKETIAEFMKNGLDAELGDELGCSKYDWTTAGTGTAAKRCAPASAMWRYLSRGTDRGSLSRSS